MENSSVLFNEEDEMELPPGFRFHPSDEELITHYLAQKVIDNSFSARAVAEVDLNKCEPWDLPWKAKMGEKEWYFFFVRDRKYPTGLRTNRATDAGYWKATGKDREIYRAKKLVGMKKTLVFYKGRAPKGEKTNWVMHEYRLEGKYSVYNLPKTENEWVVCRVFLKSSGGKKTHISGLKRLNSYGKEPRQSISRPVMDSSPHNSERRALVGDTSHVTCFSSEMEDQKPLEDMVVDSFNNSLLASSPSSSLSPASAALFSKTSPLNHFQPSKISPGFANLQNPDSFLMPDQYMLRMLLEGHAPNLKLTSRVELSQDTPLCADMSSVMTSHEIGQKTYGDEEDPSNSAGPVDLDCLWNY